MTPQDKPEALRLADRIDSSEEVPLWCGDAAGELRRQHAEIQRLKEDLELAEKVSWRLFAYAELGRKRSQMQESEVAAVQAFLGPLDAAMTKKLEQT